VRGKGLIRGKGSELGEPSSMLGWVNIPAVKLGDPCPKVRLSKDICGFREPPPAE